MAASNADDQPWSSSSRGREVDISAPGQAVWTAATNSGPDGPVYIVEQGDGTSFAGPAWPASRRCGWPITIRRSLAAKYGGRTQEVFRELVAQTCRMPPGWDTPRYGAGIVDAKALLDAPLPAPRPPLPAVPTAVSAVPGVTSVRRPVAAHPALGQLAATWSDRSIEDIVQSLGNRLGGLSGAERAAGLVRFASEIRYLAGEDPVLHQALVPPAGTDDAVPLADAEARALERLPGAIIDRRVRAGVSRSLAQLLAGRP